MIQEERSDGLDIIETTRARRNCMDLQGVCVNDSHRDYIGKYLMYGYRELHGV